MSFFDTISRIIQQGKEMAVKATPSSKQTYTKVTPVNNSQFTSNPLLRTQPLQYQKPVIQQPTFNVPIKAQIPQAKTALAKTTPMQTNETMAQTVSQIIQGGKEVIKLGNEGIVKPIVKGAAEFGLSAGEAIPRLLVPGQANKIVPPINVPGLSNYTGPLQSIESKAASRVQAGDTPGKAIVGGAVDTVLNEPFGIALKPVFAGLGLVMGSIKNVGGKQIEKTFQEVAANMTGEDAVILKNLYAEPKGKNVVKSLDKEVPIFKALGIENLPRTEQRRIVDGVVKEYDKRWSGVDEALNPPVKPNRPGAVDIKRPEPVKAVVAPVATTPLPVNKKLERFRNGKPSLEAGSIRNPLAGKAETPKINNQVVPSGNDSIENYVKENIKKRQLARGEASIAQKVKDTANLTGVKLVDFTLPITNTLNKGLKKDPIARAFLEKNPSQNVNNQIDRVLRAPALAGKYVEDKGLDKIIQQVDDVDEFDEYLIAKHAIDVDTRGINTGRNVKRDEQLVKALSPRYEKQAQAVMQYNRDLLDKVTDAGLISKETNQMLKERYPNYVPLQRVFDVMEDAPTQGSGRGVGSLSKQTVVQKLVGSDRDIESPIKSILERTNNAIFQIEKNESARLIASYEKLKDNPFNLKQINEVKDAGRGMGTISFFKDGKKIIYAVNEDVAEAAKALNVEQMNILNKVLALPVRIARAGITGLNPAFIAKNVARDQVGAFIMADRGLRALPVNPVNFLKSLWATVKHDELYDEWIRVGGGGSSYDLGREQIGPTLKRIRAGRSVASKIKYTVTRPSELLRVVEDIVARSEEITRLQQYRAARDNAVKRGLSADEAKIVGAQQSRENSTNFARRGEWGTVMNSTILYLNAGIQGSRLLVRNLKNKPLATSTKIASTLLFPTATITYWNISDPERKKAYDDIQDYEKETNLIIVSPNPVEDEQGKWNVIKIPLPPGVGNFASLVRLPIEKMHNSNPEISGEVAKSLVKSVSPIDVTSVRGVVSSLTPQIIKPSIEAITNKSLFTGNPIVNQSEEKLSPKMQVRDYTSGTAQGIANTLGVSPIKTEAFLKSTGGGITDNILNASDRALVKAGLMSPDKIGGKSVLESIKGGFVGAKGGKTQNELTDKIYEIKKTSADNAEIRKQDAERILSELKQLPPDKANARLKEIKATDEALHKKILATKLAEDLNWSKEEKAIESLGVTDGTKANFVYDQANKLQTREEKNAYLKDLLERKIISKTVIKQIKELNKGSTNNDIIQ